MKNKEVKPTIIPRRDHPISRKLISENALKVLRHLKRHNFTAYLAGGGVRDILLGREPKDFDIVTDATPEEVKKIFRNALLIGKRFRIAHVRFKGEIIEVSTFRALESGKPQTSEDGGTPKDESVGKKKKSLEGRMHSEEGMILRDNVWGRPDEDAFRRDFTVNALFYNMVDFSIIDYVGGLEDLKNGLLRIIGEPEVRYREDPVRMLRAIRFSAKLGFTIDCVDSIVKIKEDILKANPSRLYDELQKVWISDEAEKGYQLMRSTGLFEVLFPEVHDWLCREEEGFPHTFLGQAFLWIEEEIKAGRSISPALLFAIILSGPIVEQAAAFQEASGSKFPVIFKAVKSVVENFQKRISIPRRDVEILKTILYGEQRFPQTRGKRPYVWAKNPQFKDAFRYYKMKESINGESEVVKWWERFIASGKGDNESTEQRKKTPSKKWRGRRRKKRPPE